MSLPPASSPPPQSPTEEDGTNSPSPQAEGDSIVQDKRADFWPTVFRCMDVEPVIDYDKLAKEMGYKGAKSARNAYSIKLKKLGVQRVNTRAKPATKIQRDPKDPKVQKTPKPKPKPKPTKDNAQRKPRVGKPAAKKAEEQEDGPEKMAEGA